MKHAIPREKRASLAKLLYELTVMPGMDSALVELWATNCIRLIRYKKKRQLFIELVNNTCSL